MRSDTLVCLALIVLLMTLDVALFKVLNAYSDFRDRIGPEFEFYRILNHLQALFSILTLISLPFVEFLTLFRSYFDEDARVLHQIIMRHPT